MDVVTVTADYTPGAPAPPGAGAPPSGSGKPAAFAAENFYLQQHNKPKPQLPQYGYTGEVIDITASNNLTAPTFFGGLTYATYAGSPIRVPIPRPRTPSPPRRSPRPSPGRPRRPLRPGPYRAPPQPLAPPEPTPKPPPALPEAPVRPVPLSNLARLVGVLGKTLPMIVGMMRPTMGGLPTPQEDQLVAAWINQQNQPQPFPDTMPEGLPQPTPLALPDIAAMQELTVLGDAAAGIAPAVPPFAPVPGPAVEAGVGPLPSIVTDPQPQPVPKPNPAVAPPLAFNAFPAVGPAPLPLHPPMRPPPAIPPAILGTLSPANLTVPEPALDPCAECKNQKNQKDKSKKGRDKCYRGTYVDLKRGLRKFRQEEIPCR